MKKAFLILLSLFLFNELAFAQSQFLKEYVRSFSLRNSDTILIDLQIPYELIDWDRKIVRTFTQIESFSMPDVLLRKLGHQGRYSVKGDRKNNVIRIEMPEIDHAISVQGVQLSDQVVVQIYVPEGYPVRVICNSKTPEQQLKDLWLQQEVLTRRLNYPIRRAINADFYADVNFKVGKIIEAKEINGTKRFVELTVLAEGKEYSTISRIGKLYEATELVNQDVVFVAHNFELELRNRPNEGMVLVHENGSGDLSLMERADVPAFLFRTDM
jgi:tRNA-binding EMAP/Myf-like protein